MQKIYNQFLRCLKSLYDFREAEDFITLALRAKSGLARNAAEIALIVSYSRPFSGNKENILGVPHSLAKRIIKTLNASETEFHNKIVKIYRNKIVAHSELSYILPKTIISQNGALTETENLYKVGLLENADLHILSELIVKLSKATSIYASELRDMLPDGEYNLEHA